MKHVQVVCALIENEEGKIFCCKRGKGKALEGYWEFPGGKVEENETLEETIVREIKEELDSLVEPILYLGESYYEYPQMGEFKAFAITLHGFSCKLISGKLTLSEHIDSKWVSKSEMKKMRFAMADIPFIEKKIF